MSDLLHPSGNTPHSVPVNMIISKFWKTLITSQHRCSSVKPVRKASSHSRVLANITVTAKSVRGSIMSSRPPQTPSPCMTLYKSGPPRRWILSRQRNDGVSSTLVTSVAEALTARQSLPVISGIVTRIKLPKMKQK